MRWFVPALCGVAALAAVAMGEAGGGTNDPGPDPPPRTPDSSPEAMPERDRASVTALREAAAEAVPMSSTDERSLLEDCLIVPPGADPSLSPDPDAVDLAASGQTEGAAVLVWTGTAPQYERAIGTCVALDRGEGWTVVGRSVRRDLGSDEPSLAWQPAASERGAGAALAGRVREAVAELILVLDDDRILVQEPRDGVVAIPWQPVRRPERVVTVGSDGSVSYAGPLTAYADG